MTDWNSREGFESLLLFPGDWVTFKPSSGRDWRGNPTDSEDAIILHNYAHYHVWRSNATNEPFRHHEYAVFMKNGGFRAWIHASEMRLVERNRGDKVGEWMKDYHETLRREWGIS